MKPTPMKNMAYEPADPCRDALRLMDDAGLLLCPYIRSKTKGREGAPCGHCPKCKARAALATPNPLMASELSKAWFNTPDEERMAPPSPEVVAGYTKLQPSNNNNNNNNNDTTKGT